MDFRVLGPLEMYANGREVVPTAPKPRQVISLLLLRRNALVQTGELIDELWEQDPPASAMTTLQTYVYKLRRALVGCGSEPILSTKPGGYLLNVPDEAVDLYRFETDAAEGRALLEADDAERAATTLRRALALWRGAALVDVVPGALLTSYVTRLEELRARILDLRIQADLTLGRHNELVSELKALVLTRPLDEQLHASLMLALHRSGRRQEALEVFRTLRGRMIEDLGLEPGHALGALHHSLLSDAPMVPSQPGQPARERIVAGGQTPAEPAPGRRTVSEQPRPVPTAPASQLPRPAQLPTDIADFTGRAGVLAELGAHLAMDADVGSRTATRIGFITGMPGVGKTALATHLAHRLRRSYPGGQLYADLNGSSGRALDPAEVLHGFLRTLGLAEEHIPDDLTERCKTYRSATAGRRLLVLLDDAASVDQVRLLLPSDPRCAVVVTGRRRLYGLGGLWNIDLDVFDHAESLELLARIIGRDRVDREQRAARTLVDMVGRLPLALRCIGARLAAVPARSLSGMAEHLQRSREVLDELCLGELDVRSAYDASYDLLNRVEQSTFRLLSMLPHGEFTAEAVADLLGWEVPPAERLLERFADNHLLKVSVVPGARDQLHYSFPRVAHLYARERLDSVLSTMRKLPPNPIERVSSSR